MAGQTINVSILADTKQFSSAMNRLSGDSGLGKLGGAVKKLGGIMAGAFAVQQVGSFVKDSVSAASDLQQSVGAIDTVFKSSAAQMHTWAAGAASSVGLTKNEFNELGTLIGTQLKNGGTAMDQLAPKTDQLIRLGADLSSMFGGTTKDAVSALSSALKGERDPIERYGVSLTQAAIDAKAAELGFFKVGGALSSEATQAATLALIMDQTADAHGNFAKESGTFAGQTQRLKAQMSNLGTTIGTALLPMLTSAATWANDKLVPALKTLGEGAKQLWDILAKGEVTGGPLSPDSPIVATAFKIRDVLLEVGAFASQFFSILRGDNNNAAANIPWAQTLLENVPKLRDGFAAIVAAFQNAWAVLSPIFSQVATAIGAAFGDSEGGAASTFSKLVGIVGTAMSLIGAQIQMWLSVISALWSAFGPTILTVVTTVFTAVQGVISGVMTFVQGIISAVLAAIQGDWSGAWEGIRTAVSGAWQAISAIVSLGIAQARAYMSAGWAAIKAVVSAAWAAITSAISAGVNSAISFVASLPGRALAALGNIGGILTGAGRSLIQGFINGITSMISTVQSTLSGLTSKLTSWKGPPSKDATLLAGAGRLVIGGFITGMESQYGAVQRSLAGLTGTVASTQLDPLAIAGSPAGDGSDGSSLSRQDLAYLAAAVVQGLTGATLVLDGVDHMANSVAARINATYSRTVAMNSPGGR
ncbi:MAG TPA: hypothetical protein PK635_12045 [Actinomycetota bacterium]|nr:hypothetical protein [Actinomycetota bacterium]